MTPAGSVRLRIFSGPHLGAEIILPPGEHLVGSDDSCDIILSEGLVSPRHALVRIIPAQDDPPQADIRPVDDAVLIDQSPAAADGTPWSPGSPCLLGSTMLAWLPAEDTAEAWQELIAHLAKPADSNDRQATPPLATDTPVVEAGTDHAPTELANADSVDSEATPPRPRSRTAGKIIRALVVLLCLGSLAVSYEFSTRPTGVSQQELTEILKESGFTSLSVQRDGEILEVRGEVADDHERARLLRLAQSLQSPVQLDVHVRADRIGAIAFAFNSQGLFPEILKTEESNGYQVRGYMRSSQVEEAAFAAALEDFPANMRPLLVREIIHADAVDGALRPLLARTGMDFVSADYRPGMVIFSGTFSEAQRSLLESVMSETQQALGVPVPFRIVAATQVTLTRAANPANTTSAMPMAAPSPMAAEPSEASIEGLQVTGVTLSPMRFISVHTGERVFEGGLLPTGHTLESIDDKELRLRKDGVVTIYRLRGTNE
ncbi:type III secretion protein D [Desulfomicrobium norvegicum]|uniref:Type III secretion protein D n=1 Tax=Desulfomicrobium norvegicum (strain DSM 1741 / NCIMB 8310) TaxID=52561 RepID=A0A8G2BZZ8_DESNO|nr:type III secretion system inner membrane ring subunit SctD [Desulfomicrobium norvegicum]SFL29451.1 type III secretion protein D [Desulfomicrobium norvegicum]